MAKISIDGNTRLVRYTDLTLSKRVGGRPIDFANDHLVILGPDQQPVAECWPIERPAEGAPRAAPVAAPAAAPPEPGVSPGPLTAAQREILERVWAENPKATVEAVAERFEKRSGRSASAITVAKYRPAANGKAVV